MILSCVKLTVKTIQPTSITHCPPVKVMNNFIYSLFWSVKDLPLKLMDVRQGARLSVKDEQGLLVSSPMPCSNWYIVGVHEITVG